MLVPLRKTNTDPTMIYYATEYCKRNGNAIKYVVSLLYNKKVVVLEIENLSKHRKGIL